MGSAIEKFAFLPPDRDAAHAALLVPNLQPRLQYIDTEMGHKISLMHFEARTLDPKKKLTVLYSHGNSEDLHTSYLGFRTFSQMLGVDVVAYDYSGYGVSEGKCTEENTYGDINAVLKYILQLGTPRNKIVLLGRSLGSGPTVDLASRERGLGGMILISPLASAASIAGSITGSLLSSADIFVNKKKIHKVTDYPIFIVHGDQDRVVPYRHGVQLAAAAPKDLVTFFTVEGADHNDIETVAQQEYYRRMQNFLTKCSANASL